MSASGIWPLEANNQKIRRRKIEGNQKEQVISSQSQLLKQ
jgi:hypothetical protein